LAHLLHIGELPAVRVPTVGACLMVCVREVRVRLM
jgi:hypothetical protein